MNTKSTAVAILTSLCAITANVYAADDAGIIEATTNTFSVNNLLAEESGYDLVQAGQDNSALISQSEGRNLMASIEQSGANNYAAIIQSGGIGNQASILQAGVGDTAVISQIGGSGNVARIVQN